MSTELNSLISEINSKGYSHILMIGDFNYRQIDWDKMTSCDHEESQFINCIEDHYLTQHVKEPTRWRGNDTTSVLDLVFTNEDEIGG